MQPIAPGRVQNRVPDLMKEAGVGIMDLVRNAGLAVSTAYRLGDQNHQIKGIRYSTVKMLCKYFSEQLGREITPDDLMWETTK